MLTAMYHLDQIVVPNEESKAIDQAKKEEKKLNRAKKAKKSKKTKKAKKNKRANNEELLVEPIETVKMDSLSLIYDVI